MSRTTTQRGLGWQHQQERRQLPPPNGEPCPFCELPLWPDQRLHADHATPRSLGGSGAGLRWAHGWCNESAGGKLRHALAGRIADAWINRWA